MNLPLLAAGWEGLGPLLLVVIWVLRHLFAAKQEDRLEREAAERDEVDYDLPEDEATLYEYEEPTRVDVNEPPAGERPDPMQSTDPVQSEVQEFLRKIGQMQNPQAAPRQPVPVELILENPAPVRRAAVGALSQKHLAESQLAEQAAHLGERIAQADDRIDARLHKKFDHQMGQFQHEQITGHRHKDETEAEPSVAARIAKMLTTPTGMRDAVILHEILRRPSD